MKGLIIKDMSVLIKKMKFFFLILIVFSAIPDGSFLGFAVMYSALLPITAAAYDEQSKWNELAAMMPYSVFELTFSKYLLGYAFAFACAAGTFIIHSFVAAFTHTGTTNMALELTVYGGIALIIVALNIPLIFRLGTEKGRLAFIVLTVAIAGMCAGNIDRLRTLFASIDAGSMAFLPIFFCTVVLVNAVSVPLSVMWYKKKYR